MNVPGSSIKNHLHCLHLRKAIKTTVKKTITAATTELLPSTLPHTGDTLIPQLCRRSSWFTGYKINLTNPASSMKNTLRQRYSSAQPWMPLCYLVFGITNNFMLLTFFTCADPDRFYFVYYIFFYTCFILCGKDIWINSD